MLKRRSTVAADFAQQIRLTVAPFLDQALAECDVVDVGCGFGRTAIELARSCKNVVGLEPSATMAEHARRAGRRRTNFVVHEGTLESFRTDRGFDLVILDNVFEHIEDQPGALRKVSTLLKAGGVAFLLMPNRLWPIEVHYRLPFLSYLPLPLANLYLRWTGRGVDYRDASYAPTYWGLRRMLTAHPEFDFQFVLPADVSLAHGGAALSYRLGVASIRRFPELWAVSKALLVVVKKK